MLFGSFNRRFLAGSAMVGFMLAAAGCQSGDGGILSGLKGDKTADNQAVAEAQAKIKASSLRAYCPKVTLRDGTAYFNTYSKAGLKAKPRKKAADEAADDVAAPEDQSSKVVYQASIGDVTRDCMRDGGFAMTIAVAGKVVPGPMGTPGTITMPIRIVIMQGTDILYSKLHQYPVQISDMSAATQFVFKDANIVVPEPVAQNYQVFAGFDDGTQKKTGGETN